VEVASVRLLAVGDILMHYDVQRSARESGTGLRALWEDVEPLIRGADIAFANLETPVAPRSGVPGRPFRFNAPAELPAALRASGFTVLSTANNHAYDQGSAGVVETLERLRAEQLVPVGTGATRAEAERAQVVQVKGLRVAFLGFTDLYNINLNAKDGGPWVRGLDPAAAADAVRAARARADVVVVSVHWGAEYRHDPLPRQREVAGRLCAAGADLILGTHPHVLQWSGTGTTPWWRIPWATSSPTRTACIFRSCSTWTGATAGTGWPSSAGWSSGAWPTAARR
jgi:poly-gamma-glutamate synthesis protein (capsule biosynthesis protein)